MKKIIISLIFGLIIGAPTGFALSKAFSDVPANGWYSNAVLNLSDKGIIAGYSDGTFRPTNYVNRAELAVMLDRLIDYLKNGEPTSTSNSVQISQTIPSENDDFSLGNETGGDPLSVVNDTLKIKVGYSGGCADHDFTLMWDEIFMESYPVQIDLHLIHNNKGDTCEAYFNQTLDFDLTPIKNSYNEGYQTSGGTVIIHVHGSGNSKESITYEF